MKIKSTIFALGFMLTASASPVMAQGVPVIDQTNILKSIDQLNVMLKNVGIQTDILDQAKQQLGQLTKQLTQLQDIYQQFSGMRTILDLKLPSELNGILSGNFNASGVLNTLLAGSKGDWSGLDQIKSPAMKETINKSLQSAGISQDTVKKWSSSGIPSQERTAQQATSGAMLAATAEQTYKEAGQSLQRVEKILDATKNSKDIKESIDNNTRMLAELSIQLAKSLEIASIEAVYNGQGGVISAAERAEERKFFTFGNN